MTIAGLARQIHRLERGQRRRAGAVQNADNYQFTISPTCPPSTSIIFRGGLWWYPSSAFFGYGWYVPSYTVDLTDIDKVGVRLGFSGYSYTFTNADWYVPAFITLDPYGLRGYETWPDTVPDDALYLVGTITAAPYMEEFATFREAEDALMVTGVIQRASDFGLPTQGIILRNNGNTTDPNQWMAVDKVNRGRSYLFWEMKAGWELG
jgi:hypothetical protein